MLSVFAAAVALGLAVCITDRPTHRALDRLRSVQPGGGEKPAPRRVASARRGATIVAFVDAVVSELEAGAPVTSAVQSSAASLDDDVLGTVARHVAFGGDPVDVLNEAAHRPGCASLKRVAACVGVSAQAGAGLATALRRVAAGLRDDLALAREVEGQLAAPRATAKLLAALPVVVWLMGFGLGSDPLTVLVTTPYGWACLALGLPLEALGLVWVERLA
ncbi:MAG: type II secretion system F family protein, partial [Actinomycetes bacterium]